MKHSITLIIALICLANFAVAQTNITISGSAEGAAGKTIELYKYSDKISQCEVLVDQQTIGENQQFVLHGYANYPMLVFLQVDNYSQSFFVEPGRTYNLHIADFDWNIDEKKNVFLEPVALPIEFLNLPENDINILVDRFQKVTAQFVLDHRAAFDLRYHPQRRYFDSLCAEVERQCPDVEGCDFFNRYKRFQLAEMKLNMRFDSRKNIFHTYIKDQPVLCYDENYMSFFTNFYANTISKGTKDISVWQLAQWVENMKWDTYIDSIGVDYTLRHEQVRELAALLALKESYYNFRYYDAQKVAQMVERISQRSKFAEHRTIAKNILSSFQQAKEGSRIDSYSLPDVDKKLVSLDSLRGRWVYIAFVRVEEPNSLAELETMAHLLDTVYRSTDSVEFVSIDCDREFQKMYHFLKNSKHGDRYDWTWLHFDGDFDMLHHFGVYSYPWFVLISPKGELFYDVTPAPSSGFLLAAPWNSKARPEAPKRLLFQE